VNDPYGSVAWSNGTGDDLPDRIWTHDDFTPVQEFPVAELTAGFTSGAFIKAALRRRVWFWCATAVVGLLIGFGLYVKFPPAYHATATILITNRPNENSVTAMQTEATLAQSLPVAERVVHQLRLQQSVASFMAASSVTVTTDQVLTVTVGAPSGNAAVTRANALAAAFLQFRAAYLETQQQDLVAELNQQIQQAQQRLDSINAQINQVSAEPSSQTQRVNLRRLQAQGADASNALSQVKGYVVGTLAASKTMTDSMVQNSKVLDPATLAKHSRVKSVTLDVVGGLIGGMALGMGIVIVGALVSDRLRRRDEVAEALGAPVGLSVGVLRMPRWLKAIPWRAARRDLDMRRVVAYLRNAVPGSSRGPASLAVVAVDDVHVAARAVAALAVSYASEGKQVIVADLSGRAHLARLLRVKDTGMHAISRKGTNFLVTVPEPDDVAPLGPLQGSTLSAVPAQADKALVVASNSADVLLTLATFDPAVGSEYLATWATDAVVMVTAGQSSEERIRGVREMIRLTETRLDSAVLVKADKSDQSLGVSSTRDESISFGPV
jgi:capsular polysaccharide biosynthesis protein